MTQTIAEALADGNDSLALVLAHGLHEVAPSSATALLVHALR